MVSFFKKKKKDLNLDIYLTLICYEILQDLFFCVKEKKISHHNKNSFRSSSYQRHFTNFYIPKFKKSKLKEMYLGITNQ